MAWHIAQEQRERPVLLPARTRKFGNTTVDWFEPEPGVAVIHCVGGTVDDRWFAEALTREELAACGIRQALFSLDPSESSIKWDFNRVGNDKLPIVQQVDAKPLEDGRFQIKDLETRRPWYFHPETNQVFLGPPGVYHAQIEHHLKGLPNHRMRAQGYVQLDTGEVGNFGMRGRDENDNFVYQDMAGHPVNDAVAQYLGPEYWNIDKDKRPKLNPFAKTAAWTDIMAKAKRLIQSGNVTLLRNGYNIIVAHVIGDHGEYTVEISRDDPNSRAITQWTCECPWDQYAFNRTRKWKKYEARPCAHVLAAYWQALGTPLDEDVPPGAGAPPTGPHGPAPGVVPGGGIATPDGWQPRIPVPGQPGPEFSGDMPPAPGGLQPGVMPGGQAPQNLPPVPQPSQLPPMMAPPGGNQIIPPFPMDPNQLQLPVSVPGGRPGPYPANPIQQPGTLSHVVKVGAANGQFAPGMAARIKETTLGQSEGREGATDAGQWMEVPRNSIVEVRDQDATTGWVEIIYPLKGGPMTSYHVRCFVEPEKLTPLPGRPSPFQNPRR